MDENPSDPQQKHRDAGEIAFRALRQHVIETYKECKAATGDPQSALQLTSVVLQEAKLITPSGLATHLLLSAVGY
jgi:hypothetical protein